MMILAQPLGVIVVILSLKRFSKLLRTFDSDVSGSTEKSKKWTMLLRDWGKVLGELEIKNINSLNY